MITLGLNAAFHDSSAALVLTRSSATPRWSDSRR